MDTLVTGLTVYFITWWVVLFAVLPWGVHPPESPEEGHVASAPVRPRLGLKFLITSGITAIIWIVIYLLIHSGIVDLYRDAEQMMKDDRL